MDTWTDRKFPSKKFPLKWKREKLTYKHETDNFAISNSRVYMIGHWWLYGTKLPRPPPRKMEILSHKYRRSPRNLKFSHPLATQYKKKFLVPPKKIFVGGEELDHGK